MENITRTINSSYLQTSQLLGLPFSVKENTTLNEKFSIQAGILPDVSQVPRMRYFAIGNGGHGFTMGADNTPKATVKQHKSTDAALFHHLPFVLREPQNDLSVSDRAKYALRREELHDGVRYIAYYLKRIDFAGVTIEMTYNTVQNGQTVTTPYVPDSSNLNPTPTDLANAGVNVTSGDYTACAARVSLILTQFDLAELLNVARVMYDDEDLAIISEIALCSGVDKMVQSPGVGSATINFNDVIACQVCTFINYLLPVKSSNLGNDLVIDVGATEPLFLLG